MLWTDWGTGLKRIKSTAYLQLWQHGDELCFRHAAEGGALQSDSVVGEDAALARDVLGRVHVVARDHAHKDAGPGAGRHGSRHLLPHRVLHSHTGSEQTHQLPLGREFSAATIKGLSKGMGDVTSEMHVNKDKAYRSKVWDGEGNSA